MSYPVRRPPQPENLVVRGLRFQLYRWPGTDPQPVLLLHGWGDTAETWQFLVDQLPLQRTFVAVDMRGFGRTQRPDDGYWFPDYLADLDELGDQLVPGAPFDLIGHSMGGNIAMLYAGARPHRVRRLVSLEGFGMPRTTPDQAPARYAEWLDEVKQGSRFAVYDEYEQFVRVLARRNPRTPPERLDFIARSWARRTDEGRIELWADPKHKRVNPVLYQRDQAEACWSAIQAPLLFVRGGASDQAARMAQEMGDARLREIFRDVTPATIADAGHMMHHERPEELAAVIAAFLEGLEGQPRDGQR
jgi:pimeloyl-ACP methyl ester carboxylesterase